jgi:hypothetical protein
MPFPFPYKDLLFNLGCRETAHVPVLTFDLEVAFGLAHPLSSSVFIIFMCNYTVVIYKPVSIYLSR